MAKKRAEIPIPGEPGNNKRTRKRFIVFAKDDGSPDLDNLPPELQGHIGASGAPQASDQPAPPPAEFDASIIKIVMPVIVGLEAMLVGPRMGIPVATATQCLTPPPPLADAIAQAATKVLNKYSAPLGRWADEIALAALLATWQVSAFAAMRRYAPIDVQSEEPPPPPDRHESYQPPPPPPPPPTATGMSPQDEERIREELRNLGRVQEDGE